jgi:hypothetical protein
MVFLVDQNVEIQKDQNVEKIYKSDQNIKIKKIRTSKVTYLWHLPFLTWLNLT